MQPSHDVWGRQTCYVPQLQPDHGAVVPLEHLQREVHPDGGSVVLGEDLMHVSLDDGRFSDSQVPDDQDFEQKLLLHGRSTDQNAMREKLEQHFCGLFLTEKVFLMVRYHRDVRSLQSTRFKRHDLNQLTSQPTVSSSTSDDAFKYSS